MNRVLIFKKIAKYCGKMGMGKSQKMLNLYEEILSKIGSGIRSDFIIMDDQKVFLDKEDSLMLSIKNNKHELTEIELLKTIFKNNNNVFLMACGDDYPVIKYYLDGNQKYHILSPYMESDSLSKASFSLKYVNDSYKNLFYFVYENVKAVIPSDIDYHLPWKEWKKTTPIIPNPLIIPDIYFPIEIKNRKINIFLGINTLNYEKKGYRLFEEALVWVKNKYSDKVNIIKTYNVPFNEYVKHINSCDILLDTIYAYDQGYNALESMARGKVVFTGAEEEFTTYYNIEKPVNINALPNAISIYNELEKLILNPNKIEEIGKNARLFTQKEHDYRIIAKKYITTWKKHL